MNCACLGEAKLVEKDDNTTCFELVNWTALEETQETTTSVTLSKQTWRQQKKNGMCQRGG